MSSDNLIVIRQPASRPAGRAVWRRSIPRTLVAASLLFACDILLVRAAESVSDIFREDASDMLKNLRSLEDALTEKRIEQQDNARLLDELTADKKALLASRLPEDASTLLENAKARIAGIEAGSDTAKSILDDLLKVQTAFVLPFNQIVDSLWQGHFYSRSPATNQTTASLANLMNS